MESPKIQRNTRIMPWNRMLEVGLEFSDLSDSRRDKGKDDYGHGLSQGEGRLINEQDTPDG